MQDNSGAGTKSLVRQRQRRREVVVQAPWPAWPGTTLLWHWRLPKMSVAPWGVNGTAVVSQWQATTKGHWQGEVKQADQTLVFQGRALAELEPKCQMLLHFRLQGPVTGRVQAKISSRWRQLSAVSAANGWQYLLAPLPVGGMNELRWDLKTTGAGLVTMDMGFLVLVPETVLKQAAPPAADPTWPGCLAEQLISDPHPLMGVALAKGELEPLRDELQCLEYARLWLQQVRRAERFAMHAPVPERYATRVLGQPPAPNTPAHAPPWAELSAMLQVGLVAQRPDLLRLSARWGLTWSQCASWADSPLDLYDDMPRVGPPMQVAQATQTMAVILDWAGSLLTAAGQHCLAQAIYDQGLQPMLAALDSAESAAWSAAQRLHLALALGMGGRVIEKWYPQENPGILAQARALWLAALADLASADGVPRVPYRDWVAACQDALALLRLLAQAEGVTQAELAPAPLRATARWAVLALRCDHGRPALLPWLAGPSERPVPPLLAALGASALGVAEWAVPAARQWPATVDPAYVLAAREWPPAESRSPFSLAGPEHLPAPEPVLLAASGQAWLPAASPRLGAELWFNASGSAPRAQDALGLWFAPHGQPVLVERGGPPVALGANAGREYLAAQAHSTVTAAKLGRTPPSGLVTLLRHDEHAVLMQGTVTLDGNPKHQLSRQLLYLREGLLLILDQASFSKSMALRQHWQAPAAISATADGWTWQNHGVGACLRRFGPTPGKASLPAAIHELGWPTLQRLSFTQAPATKHRVLTVIDTRATPKNPWHLAAFRWQARQQTLHLTLTRGPTLTLDLRHGELPWPAL